MKRVGLIDNLQNISNFIFEKYETATADDCMAATGGNTGNVAFVYAARKIIKNPIVRIEWGMNPIDVKNSVDHLVICCANQIGTHVDLGWWATCLERFGLPVTLLGLGAQSDSQEIIPEIPAGTQKFLQVVGQLNYSSNSNIAVRGGFTQNVLSINDVVSLPIGCPSLHISSVRNLGSAILEKQNQCKTKRVAVSAGNPWHARSAFLERTLVDIVDAYRGEYIIQHPKEMLQFAFGENDGVTPQVVARFLEVYGPKFNLKDLFEWYRYNSAVYVDAASWLRALRKFDLSIGPRYHGVALAIQAGIPGCVITIDSRTEELCSGTSIKSLAVSDVMNISTEDLISKSFWSDEDAEKFDVFRACRAKDYVDFLQSNELCPSDALCINSSTF